MPIGEAEQFYIALKGVGVDTVMIRYPREGHGIRETKHAIDASSGASRGTIAIFAGSSRRSLTHEIGFAANRVRDAGS